MWSSNYVEMPLDQIPSPTVWGSGRCHFDDFLDRDNGDLGELDRFIAQFGPHGAARGCCWHAMEDPAAVLRMSRIAFQVLESGPEPTGLSAITAVPGIAELSSKDQKAVWEFVAHPITIAANGEIADGGHRICALRHSGLGDVAVLVRDDRA